MDADTQRTRITVAGILLGLGLGGFFDGIVLHQILQWHHMLTSTGNHPATTVAGLEVNTLWDGFFHLSTYIMTVVGLWILTRVLSDRDRSVPWSTTAFIGLMLMGWGAFNVVEGLVDHHLLGIHHVRTGENQTLWDVGFLIWGAAMFAGGWILKQQGWQAEHTTVHVPDVERRRGGRRKLA
jgi:uncharacterized membrane protein